MSININAGRPGRARAGPSWWRPAGRCSGRTLSSGGYRSSSLKILLSATKGGMVPHDDGRRRIGRPGSASMLAALQMPDVGHYEVHDLTIRSSYLTQVRGVSLANSDR
jgi:hypothetical protein